jgi:hypothetical protein
MALSVSGERRRRRVGWGARAGRREASAGGGQCGREAPGFSGGSAGVNHFSPPGFRRRGRRAGPRCGVRRARRGPGGAGGRTPTGCCWGLLGASAFALVTALRRVSRKVPRGQDLFVARQICSFYQIEMQGQILIRAGAAEVGSATTRFGRSLKGSDVGDNPTRPRSYSLVRLFVLSDAGANPDPEQGQGGRRAGPLRSAL